MHNVNDLPNALDADAITKVVKSAYINGDYDEVYIVYAEFVSAMTQVPKTVKVLPIGKVFFGFSADSYNTNFQPFGFSFLNAVIEALVKAIKEFKETFNG